MAVYILLVYGNGSLCRAHEDKKCSGRDGGRAALARSVSGSGSKFIGNQADTSLVR